MPLDITNETGVALDRQVFSWRELAGSPYSKLDDHASTRIRVILMNGIESQAVRFSHACARSNRRLQEPLARLRRIEQHQQTLVNWLNPADQSPLETTIGYEQVAIEVTAALAQQEPDPYLARVYRFGLLEDFDHLYRFSALLDRVEGKDPNNILQGYTDIGAGRPTAVQHRDPFDDLRKPYNRCSAHPITKLNALTLLAAKHQARDYYMNIGPGFADPAARQLYAEIASVEEQHVTQYESIIDPDETWIEKWLMHELGEVYNYWSCLQQESNPRVKAIWHRFLDYELGHLHFVREIMEEIEQRDPAELLPETLPDPIAYESQREFVREVLETEINLRASGGDFIDASQEPADGLSARYRARLVRDGSPSEVVGEGYRWVPGTECAQPSSGAAALKKVRLHHARTASALGTMPAPTSVKGAVEAVVAAVNGDDVVAFLDLLGERLAFERTGTRLYDGLLVKLEAGERRRGGPTRDAVEEIRDDELRHLALLKQAIEALGGDPTVMTPAADVVGIASAGWIQALGEPRTTLTEALKVILAAELVDNDGWDLLAEIAEGMGYEEWAVQFRAALADEESHLLQVRTWVALSVGSQTGAELPVTGNGAGMDADAAAS